MPRQANLLNVKKQLEWTNRVIEDICKETLIAHPNGTRVAPIFHMELRKIKFLNEAILRKHALKKTRKDIQF